MIDMNVNLMWVDMNVRFSVAFRLNTTAGNFLFMCGVESYQYHF